MTYIVDDTGKKITVIIKPSQKVEYDILFTNNTKVKTTYNVTGVYRYSSAYGNNIIEYPDIQPYTRKLLDETERTVENITISDTKGITFSVNQGWERIRSII